MVRARHVECHEVSVTSDYHLQIRTKVLYVDRSSAATGAPTGPAVPDACDTLTRWT